MQALSDISDSASLDRTIQFLTFVLDSEEYAIDILRVQEIKSWSLVTKIPKSPAYVLGVINLRGSIVPIIDLRGRFGLPTAEITNKTAVIIVRTEVNGSERVMGLVVDRVSEVYHFKETDIQSSATMSGNINSEFFGGLAKAEKHLVILLNLDRIVDEDVLEAETLGGSADGAVVPNNPETLDD